MRIELTGQVRIEDGERVLDEPDLPGRQGRLVFACLALSGEPVHRDVLAEALWPSGPPSTWERTLSGVVSRLRSGFAAAGFEELTIANAFSCYQLRRPAGARLDIEVATQDVEAAERALSLGDLAAASSAAESAASIARRPLVPGEDGDWLDTARTALRSVLVRALDVAVSASLGSPDAIAPATEAIALEPYREASHVLLMRAHAALGNIVEALRAYERCRSLLGDELGVDPSPDTQALHIALLQADEDAMFNSLAAQGLLSLPPTLTRFVGRTEVLRTVLELLSTERVVTLVGPGGVGKTRLAVEVARSSLGTHPDGIYFVDLTQLGAASNIAAHVANAVGVRIGGDVTTEALTRVLDTQRVLLVLDNCEHVVDACRMFVEELEAATPNVVVLATSRSPLDVSMECVWDVPPLDVPGADEGFEALVHTESVTLFCDRATAVRPHFELTAGNARAVAEICHRLEGIPLAIELAAGRAGTFSVAEIAEHFAEREGPPTPERAPRHRTLQAAIDWSYDLLGRREADCFRSLSVFEGWFTAVDAHAVCGRGVDVELGALADQSLLVRDVTRVAPRYRMLETIKRYGRERIDGTDGWECAVDRHIGRYVALVREVVASDQVAQLGAIDASSADAALALDRALGRTRTGEAIVLAEGLWKWWLARGLTSHGSRVLEETIAQGREAGLGREIASLLQALGTLVFNQSDFARAELLLLEALDIASAHGDEQLRAVVLANLASTAYAMQRLDEAVERAERAIASAEIAGDHQAAGLSYMQLCAVAYQKQDFPAANRAAELALERFTLANSQSGIARALIAVAGVADTPRADSTELLERAVEVSRAVDDRNTLAIALVSAGLRLAETGRLGQALDRFHEALPLARRLGDIRLVLNCAEQIACVASEWEMARDAASLFAGVDAQRAARSIAPSYVEHTGRLERLVNRATDLSGADADRAKAAGAQLGFDALVDLAMSIGAGAGVHTSAVDGAAE